MAIPIIANFDLGSPLPLDARSLKADTTERDSIPIEQRYEGLIVYVAAEAKSYQLQGGIENNDWGTTMPIATAVDVGGVKVGLGLSITDGVLAVTAGASMTYPDAGIPLSTGSAWDTSIVNNSSNWDTAFSWGDHSLVGYLTSGTETDPIYSAWDKSTGISITENQISDLGSYETAFSKNTAFNKDFGDTVGTVTQGNDSRMANGQTAFEWGDWDVGVTKVYVDALGINATHLGGILAANNYHTLNANLTTEDWTVKDLYIDTFKIEKILGVPTLLFTGNIAATGGIQSYTDGTFDPQIWDSIPKTQNTVFGIMKPGTGLNVTTEGIVDVVDGGTAAIWGQITGTLSAQTDLNSALGAKQPLAAVLTNTTASFLTAQETKLSHISVSQAVNLDTMESNIATNNAKVGYTDALVAAKVTKVYVDALGINATHLGGTIAANYYHSGNSNLSTVNWNADSMTANSFESKGAAILYYDSASDLVVVGDWDGAGATTKVYADGTPSLEVTTAGITVTGNTSSRNNYEIRDAAGVLKWTINLGISDVLEFKNASGVIEATLTQAGAFAARAGITSYGL